MKRFAYAHDRLCNTALVTLCVCLWLCVVSCSPTPTNPVDPSPALPTLGQVRSRLPQKAGSTGLPDPTPGDRLPAMLHVSQLDVPLSVSTEPAWALSDQHGLDPLAVDAWRANGLRVGFLKAANYELFLKALVPGHPARNRRTTLTEQPIVCTTVPKHKDRRAVRLAMPPAQKPSTLQVGPGRFQFLAQLVQGPNDTAALRLTPHHYQPRTTIRPRQPQDKIQDGFVFHDLALSMPLDSGSWLVIGLDTPQLPPPDQAAAVAQPDPSPAENPVTTQPTTQPGAPKPVNFGLPNHLGRALLTASRFGKPIQIVMIVAVTQPQESTSSTAKSPTP